ncbi:MAG: helix-turn-helix transcriptional regulator [Candidatus Eremiobacteraeota bacterium]|nr:helix-turn-helix transcriptional regulator [Candidatus Eremiobacteraeota bacterium]MBV8371785.1 helix-turn-helix transcriptional regulator [Candidatus Eremiobacteraeota bacterium]
MSSSQPIHRKNPLSSESGNEELCPRFHRAVELIGRRWTGAIIRVLLPGPRRFNELLAAVPGISDRLLTERLRELESVEIIRREVRPESPVRVQYELTRRGRELREPLDALGRWAERWIGAEEQPLP